MSKQYQTTDVQASMSSVLGLAVPEQVTIALAEIAESAKEGLLALAVGAALADVPVVVACSALKRSYRDRLRAAAPDLALVYLSVPRDVLAERMTHLEG